MSQSPAQLPPLSGLAPSPQGSRSVTTTVEEKSWTKSAGGWAVPFIVAALITWLILYTTRPSWVMKKDPLTGQPTNQFNYGWMALIIIVVGLIVAALWRSR